MIILGYDFALTSFTLHNYFIFIHVFASIGSFILFMYCIFHILFYVYATISPDIHQWMIFIFFTIWLIQCKLLWTQCFDRCMFSFLSFRSEVTGSYHRCIFNFIRICFPKSLCSFLFHLQSRGVFDAPHPHQHLYNQHF
jgi:hypothetical protein